MTSAEDANPDRCLDTSAASAFGRDSCPISGPHLPLHSAFRRFHLVGVGRIDALTGRSTFSTPYRSLFRKSAARKPRDLDGVDGSALKPRHAATPRPLPRPSFSQGQYPLLIRPSDRCFLRGSARKKCEMRGERGGGKEEINLTVHLAFRFFAFACPEARSPDFLTPRCFETVAKFRRGRTFHASA